MGLIPIDEQKLYKGENKLSEILTSRDWLRTFQSWRHRNFRLVWLAQLASSWGMWMEVIGRNLLVYDLTGSSAALALLNFLRAVPQLLFTLWGGILADRIDRKKIVMALSVSNSLPTAFISMVGVGAAMNGFWVLTGTLLQKDIEDDYRGRVMSLYSLDSALTSAAAVVAGMIADNIGISLTFALMASGCLIVSGATWVLAPSVRKMT